MVRRTMKRMWCKDCGEFKEHLAHGLCARCYKRSWKPKLIICKNCKKEKPHDAKGYCSVCYNKLFVPKDYQLAYRLSKEFDLDIGTYKKMTKECSICGFNKVVDLHHKKDKIDNLKENLIALCPNHHSMIHRLKMTLEEVIKDWIGKK